MGNLIKILAILILFTSCDKVKDLVGDLAGQGLKKRVRQAGEETPVKGYHTIGLAKYCNEWQNAPDLPAVSALMNTVFGDPLPCIEDKIKKDDSLSDVMLTIRDATCFRGYNGCPSGTPNLTDLNIIKSNAQRINNYTNVYPNVNWWVSPYLEHDRHNSNGNISQEVLNQTFEVIKAECPKCKVFNQPLSGYSVAGVPDERHGTKSDNTGMLVSGDGASIFQADNIGTDGNNFQHRTAGTEITLGWIQSFNRRCDGYKTFIAIDKRTLLPKATEFKAVHKILTTEVDEIPSTVPVQCREVREIKAPMINKTFAENYCNDQPNASDPRGGRNLIMVPERLGRGNQIQVIGAKNGKLLTTMVSWGDWEGNKSLERYYVGKTPTSPDPFELYEANENNEWAYALFPNGVCYRYNVLRREGTYR